MDLVLKIKSRWDTVMVGQDGIGLLLVICKITHKQDGKIQSTVAYIKAFLEFATTYQEPKQSKIDYYAMLKSRRDVVMAHFGQLGYHLKLYDKHWKSLMVTEGIVDKQAITTAKQEKCEQLTIDSSFK